MHGSGYTYISYAQRLEISDLLKKNSTIKEIAQITNRDTGSIYREITFGSINGVYDPDYAQSVRNERQKNKGRPLVIDEKIAIIISNYILKENLTVLQIKKALNAKGLKGISTNTIYAAIDKGLIPNVTRESLINKTTKVFSKGLIQLPVWIRSQLKLSDGDTVSIDLIENEVVIKKL